VPQHTLKLSGSMAAALIPICQIRYFTKNVLMLWSWNSIYVKSALVYEVGSAGVECRLACRSLNDWFPVMVTSVMSTFHVFSPWLLFAAL